MKHLLKFCFVFVAILWITACNKDDCQDTTLSKSAKTGDSIPVYFINYEKTGFQKPIYVYSSTFTETLNGDFYYWNKCQMITNIKC